MRTTRASDGLIALKMGPWASEKIFLIQRYLDIAGVAMREKFTHRVYIELFAGPGRCVLEGGEEVDGSPVSALKVRVPFTHYFFNDLERLFVDALRTRVEGVLQVLKSQGKQVPQVSFYCTDWAEAGQEIAERLRVLSRARTLAVVFIDPPGLQLAPEVLERFIQANRATDFILTVHVRAIKRVLGALHPHSDLGKVPAPQLLDPWAQWFKGQGYPFVDYRVQMRNRVQVPLYYLLFASRHERAQDFWNKSVRPIRLL